MNTRVYDNREKEWEEEEEGESQFSFCPMVNKLPATFAGEYR